MKRNKSIKLMKWIINFTSLETGEIIQYQYPGASKVEVLRKALRRVGVRRLIEDLKGNDLGIEFNDEEASE